MTKYTGNCSGRHPAEQWRSYPVSTRVNDPTNDDPGVIKAVTPERQTGLG